jgi:1-acyl-sn-glycerol-3-phosphate acyltransferase
VAFVRTLVRSFFRRVEVSGLEDLPDDCGGILVAWHPNGMVDPGLILASFAHQVVFGARHSVFHWPGLGALMRALGTVPIYRASDTASMDPDARRQANLGSLDALARRVAAGSFSCLFPEGRSHDAPHAVDLKTGAARFYYRARQLAAADAPRPVLIPVGLHYDAKRDFRSSALVAYHPPIELPAELDVTPAEDEPEEVGRERCRVLTAEIDRILEQTVLATESWDLHFLMHRTRKLVRAERASRAGADPGRPAMLERTLGFARVWEAYRERLRTDPDQVEALKARIEEYDEDLRALRIEDHELDRNPRLASPLLGAILLLQVAAVYLLLPPLLLVGYMVNLPVAIGLWVLTRLVANKRKDEATVKVLFGAVAFPISWIAAGGLTIWTHHRMQALFPSIPDAPLLAGLFIVALGVLGGLVALRYVRLVRETARAVRVRLTRRRRAATLERLRAERAELFEQVMAMAEGLDLPGRVADDGRVEARREGQQV